jgi:hypothetical protein
MHSTSKRLAMAAAGGILASVAGCGGASPPPPEVSGAPAQGALGPTAAPPAAAKPAEKHACGGANGCSATMHQKKGPNPEPASGAPKSP